MTQRSTQKMPFLGLIGLTLIISAAMHANPGSAAERPGHTMGEISAKLASAHVHATTLAEDIGQMAADPNRPPALGNGDQAGDPGQREHDQQHRLPERRADAGATAPSQGGGFPAGGSGSMPPRRDAGAHKVTKSMQSGLREIELAMVEAKGLADGNAYLVPGIEHVLANVRVLGAEKTLPTDALSLSHEIEIELYALGNNALILGAEDYLRAASTASAKGKTEQTREFLGAAAGALDQADQRGAYHVHDDLQTLTFLLEGMKPGADEKAGVSAPVIEDLINDLHGHLSDLREE